MFEAILERSVRPMRRKVLGICKERLIIFRDEPILDLVVYGSAAGGCNINKWSTCYPLYTRERLKELVDCNPKLDGSLLKLSGASNKS